MSGARAFTKAKLPALVLHKVPADRQQIDRTRRIVERVWRAIESGVFYPAPSPMKLLFVSVPCAVQGLGRLESLNLVPVRALGPIGAGARAGLVDVKPISGIGFFLAVRATSYFVSGAAGSGVFGLGGSSQ